MPNHAVICPKSNLALKVEVLKKAVDLAAKEKATVRIPMATQGETKNFGVFAVPSVETHVFVGPFTSNTEEISDNYDDSDDDSDSYSDFHSDSDSDSDSDFDDDDVAAAAAGWCFPLPQREF